MFYFEGAGIRGSYNLGNGNRIGGYVHRNFGGGTGGKIVGNYILVSILMRY